MTQARPARERWLRPPLADIGIAVFFVALTVAETWAGESDRAPWQLTVALIGMAALAWRRVSPVGAAATLVVANIASNPDGDFSTILALVVASYTVGFECFGRLRIVGVTGSNGKTTTKDLLAQVLDDAVAPEGSFNNEIGLPLTVLRADEATRHLVLEMGASAPGDLAYLTGIAPLDVAVVLTVGTAHLGGYGSPEALAEEKATLLDGLVPGGAALLNADDARVAAMAGRPSLAAEDRTVRTFGVGGRADLAAGGLRLDHGRAAFVVRSGEDRSAELTLRLVGEHHVTNALAALGVALETGMDLDTAAERVSAAVPLSPHRMALTERADGVWILDDSYNASPESMRAALRALKEVAVAGRSFAVIGEMREMGDASRAGHEEIGLDAVRLRIDHLLVVGEGAKPAHASAVREGSWGDEAAYVATIDEARDFLDGRLLPGDTVLLKASHGSGLWRLADEMLGVDA